MIREAIIKLSKKEDLTYQEAYECMNEIMDDQASDIQKAAYLTAFSLKGEAPENGTGAEAGVEDGLTASKVSHMRNADLLALAEEKNISLEGCSKHDEYVERINGALGLVDFSKLGLE